MSLRLDHLVIAVLDLARAVEDYRALGFTVQHGGRHPGRTSHNALVVFEDDAYLELIAWTEPGTDERWYDVLAKHGEGLTDFALVPDDVPGAVADAKARGLALNGPFDGGRLRPDGQQVKWQHARQTTFDLPFLCGDVTPRELRVPLGDCRRHANGAAGIASVEVAVFNIEVSLARYAALLGIDETDAPAPVALPELGVQVAPVRIADTTVVLMTPLSTTPEDSPTLSGELRQRLATRGEGPCGMTIRTTMGEGGLLDAGLTHRVVMEMVSPKR